MNRGIYITAAGWEIEFAGAGGLCQAPSADAACCISPAQRQPRVRTFFGRSRTVLTIYANSCSMFLLVAEHTVTLALLCIGGCLSFLTLPSSHRRRLQRYCFSQGLHKGVRVAVVGATRPMQKRPPHVGSWGAEASRKERENVRHVKTFDVTTFDSTLPA